MFYQKKQAHDNALKRDEIDGSKSELLELRRQVDGLLAQNIEPENAATVENLETHLEQVSARITAIDDPNTLGPNAIQIWEQQYLALQNQLELALSPAFDWKVLVGLLVLAGLLLGLFLKTSMGAKAKVKPLNSALKFTDTPGVIFAASPMLAGNVAAPLAPAGQLAAAQLQMLSGPYSILKEAYLATGRIGYAQVGIPYWREFTRMTLWNFISLQCLMQTRRHILIGMRIR